MESRTTMPDTDRPPLARFDRRLFLAGAAATMIAAPAWSAPRRSRADLAGVDPAMIDDLLLIDDMEVSAADLDRFRHRPGARPAHPAPPPAVPVAPPVPRMVPGLPGRPPVRTVQFDGGPGRRGRGAVVWMHGGGYVAGAAGIPVDLRVAARDHGWLVVSVDYRLAPEAAFPAALDDNLAALCWVHANAATLGVDPARIAIGGASAGGGHAAMLAFAARDRTAVRPACQILIYPMLDDRTGSSRPARPDTGRFVWTAASNRFGWSSLLGVPAGGVAVPAGAVPARRTDLAGLPPAFVGVGTLDLFLDEDLAYAAALTAAGVPVDLRVVPAAFHAFDGIAPQAPASRAFTTAWIARLAAAIG
jgi:acetyl esterase/lipase